VKVLVMLLLTMLEVLEGVCFAQRHQARTNIHTGIGRSDTRKRRATEAEESHRIDGAHSPTGKKDVRRVLEVLQVVLCALEGRGGAERRVLHERWRRRRVCAVC